MGAQTNVAPVIIKRKKVVGGDGHHGGAWKVAYADFVTAMMAFFMLMWLLNATTEKQRKGIADYFNPNVPINRISGGGDGMFGGESIFAEALLAKNGTGGMPPVTMAPRGTEDVGHSPKKSAESKKAEEDKAFGELDDLLIGNGGESMSINNEMKHVVTRQTDEGMTIEIFDLRSMPLFIGPQDTPSQILKDLVRMIAEITDLVTNPIAVEGHTRSVPVVIARNQTWKMSAGRADKVRVLLETYGIAPERLSRVTGHADRELVAKNPMSLRNNRIEIILLRE